MANESVFVRDLNHRDRWFIDVSIACIPVAVGEKRSSIFLLMFDDLGMIQAQPFIEIRASMRFRKSLSWTHSSRDVQVQIAIYPVFLQLVDEIIKAVELAGIQPPGNRSGLPNSIGSVLHIHVVKSHQVDAEAGQLAS